MLSVQTNEQHFLEVDPDLDETHSRFLHSWVQLSEPSPSEQAHSTVMAPATIATTAFFTSSRVDVVFMIAKEAYVTPPLQAPDTT